MTGDGGGWRLVGVPIGDPENDQAAAHVDEFLGQLVRMAREVLQQAHQSGKVSHTEVMAVLSEILESSSRRWSEDALPTLLAAALIRLARPGTLIRINPD